jgi:hypothetical protein
MKLQHKLVLTVLALTLSLGLAPAALAGSLAARGGLLRGEVTAIAGDSLAVQMPQDEVVLLIDEETIFEVPGIEDATLDDLAVGDFVVARAVRGHDDEIVARHVAVIPSGSLEDELLRGIVSSVDGETFQLRVREGEVQVITDQDTVVRIPDVDDATVADLEEGRPVVVMGQFGGEGEAFNASAVAVIPGWVIQWHLVRGELVAVEGDTLVLTAGRGADQEKRVQTTDETTFRIRGVEVATVGDLDVGDRIVALGHEDASSGDFIARSVAVVPRRPRHGLVDGEVTAVGEDFVMLETPYRGQLTCTVTDETRFRIPGDDDPSLEDIAVGDYVAVIGYRDRDGDLMARGVGRLTEYVVRGEVTAIEGAMLEVETVDGSVTVQTDEGTRFRIPGNDDGSLQARVVSKPRQSG